MNSGFYQVESHYTNTRNTQDAIIFIIHSALMDKYKILYYNIQSQDADI